MESATCFALVIGMAIGLAIVRWRLLRTAVLLITGLQTMPSIAWFPLAILLFGLSEAAIMFVIVLGAAPSIANGLINGVDHVPRILLRAGGARREGCRPLPLRRPAGRASAFVGGMKQAWAFAWRSLMAGELLVIIAQQPSLGVSSDQRDLSDAEGLLATMASSSHRDHRGPGGVRHDRSADPCPPRAGRDTLRPARSGAPRGVPSARRRGLERWARARARARSTRPGPR